MGSVCMCVIVCCMTAVGSEEVLRCAMCVIVCCMTVVGSEEVLRWALCVCVLLSVV